MNRGLTPKFGLNRLHRKTIGLLAAIPTSLANSLVNGDSKFGGFKRLPLTFPSQFCRTLLIMNEHRHSGSCAQFFLCRNQIITTAHVYTRWERTLFVPTGFVSSDDDALHTVSEERVCDVAN